MMRRNTYRLMCGALLAPAFLSAGCIFPSFEIDLFPRTPAEPGEGDLEVSDWDDGEVDTDVNNDGGHAPLIESIEHVSWPPLGPGATIEVTISDDDGDLDEFTATFRNEHSVWLSGSSDHVSITAEDLGDGYGPLLLEAADDRNAFDRVTIPDTLVDLGAPSADVQHALVNAQGVGEYGALSVWIGDAWVLGGADIWVGDELIASEAFPEGYPAGFDTEWDWSVIDIAPDELPPGSSVVEVVVYDAAGNTEAFAFDIRVDAEPPEALLYAPAAGAQFDGPFEILAGGTDLEDEDSAVWLEVLLGGALVAEGPGPLLSATVDPTDFVPGETALEVWAYDVVGNRAPFAPVPVILGAGAP